jgi:signal transduction histidine kinase
MGTVALAAMIMRRMVDRLWEVAEDERIAREEIEGVNAELDLAYRHKNAFLANMSHELRTPLNVIIGFAEVLSSEAFGPLSDEQAEYIDEILTSARQLLGLINDVLDLGKLDAGRMDRIPQLLVMGELLEPAFDEAATIAAARGVAFRRFVRHREAIIEADDATVRRAVSALAVSAVLATPPGGTCEASADVDEEGLVVLVSDGGAPLSVDDRRDLLEEMVSVEGRDTQQALRLALAGRFASLNGGALTLKAGNQLGNDWTLNVPARVLSLS